MLTIYFFLPILEDDLQEINHLIETGFIIESITKDRITLIWLE